jgi:hypothetical protein
MLAATCKALVVVIVAGSMLRFSCQTGGHAEATNSPTKQPDPAEQTKRMGKKLGLSEEQKSRVLLILTDALKNKKDLYEKLGDAAKNSSDWKAINEDKANKLKEVLTEKQYKKYLELKEEIKQQDQFFWEFETGP